jgi:hypothetical protein
MFTRCFTAKIIPADSLCPRRMRVNSPPLPPLTPCTPFHLQNVFFGKDMVAWLTSPAAGAFQVASKADAMAVGQASLLKVFCGLLKAIVLQATPCSNSSWHTTAWTTTRLRTRTSTITGLRARYNGSDASSIAKHQTLMSSTCVFFFAGCELASAHQPVSHASSPPPHHHLSSASPPPCAPQVSQRRDQRVLLFSLLKWACRRAMHYTP